jgi:hypothetical protein
MQKKNIDELIEKSIGDSSTMKKIDVRKETMARIVAFEKKRAAHRRIINWAISIFTIITSLASVYVFEIIVDHFWLFFLRLNLNILTVKIIFQGFFLAILLTAVIIMIINQKYRKELYNFI